MPDLNNELPDDWKDILPEDIRESGVLNGITSISQMAKMTIDARKYGSTSIRIPSEDASDDDKKAFKDDLMTKIPDLMYKPDMENQDSINEVMKTLGMPEEPTGYELPEIPDPIKDSISHLTEKAHSAGLTNKQFTAITEGILDDFKTNSEMAYGALEEQKTSLKKEWGAAYDQKVDTISHFAKQTGFSEEFVDAIKNGQVDSTNMKAFETVVGGYEGGAVELGRQATNPEVVMTPSEAESRLDEIMSNRDHAYWHAEDPQHKTAVDKVLDLGKLADTGEKSETELFRESLMGG